MINVGRCLVCAGCCLVIADERATFDGRWLMREVWWLLRADRRLMIGG